ncbi:sugar ABC transporter ATP-binding protein [Bacillus sp. FJAT-50079]|uniref:sugar ABC transporter ATP-binding protein n=1 Tax=Bacillus sp. FJAT-50079 TaxID=2833577 RepID=UPI001BC98D2C|nr:sugar ABC transporter ATP-binding protein [Bacillus sp. FJAT-50079]MBS4210485.1 sugar ABC transporter ATP-binding protein [Bacillus sp. FJAT-50079]
MSDILIDVENISKSFSGVQALDQVNLTIKVGEIHCLMGGNGCGKSTLIKLISGVEVPSSGRIVIGKNLYKRLRPIDAIREGIQVIYQDFSLFPNLTVAENIALGSEVAKGRRVVNWKGVSKIAKDALKQIGANMDLNALVETLSVSDKQMIAISRAIVQKAKLIIMDEPTTALTEKEVATLFRIIKRLQAKGIAILFVSHKLNEVFNISEHITVLRNGKNVVSGDVRTFNQASLVKAMTGREIKGTPYLFQKQSKDKPSLLKVENYTKRNKFKDIFLELYPGEILGITGLLGSGRTEFALSLYGMEPADSGNLSLNGKQVRIKSVHDSTKHGIAYVPEDRLTEGLFLSHSIGKNIMIGSIRNFASRLNLIAYNRVEEETSNWMKRLNISTPSSDLPVSSLSGGNQQRVVLAKCLATKPQILILNGPTVGVDVGSKADIYSILRKLAKEGMGIVIISDDIPELVENCNRVIMMKRGRIDSEYAKETLTEEDLNRGLQTDVKERVI